MLDVGIDQLQTHSGGLRMGISKEKLKSLPLVSEKINLNTTQDFSKHKILISRNFY